MEENTEKTFSDKLLEIRKLITSLCPSFSEQYALSSAVTHHFDLKYRLQMMELCKEKAMTTSENLHIQDGGFITRTFEVTTVEDGADLSEAQKQAIADGECPLPEPKTT